MPYHPEHPTAALSQEAEGLLTPSEREAEVETMAHLGKPLEEYTAKWTGRVRLIRSGEMD